MNDYHGAWRSRTADEGMSFSGKKNCRKDSSHAVKEVCKMPLPACVVKGVSPVSVIPATQQEQGWELQDDISNWEQCAHLCQDLDQCDYWSFNPSEKKCNTIKATATVKPKPWHKRFYGARDCGCTIEGKGPNITKMESKKEHIDIQSWEACAQKCVEEGENTCKFWTFSTEASTNTCYTMIKYDGGLVAQNASVHGSRHCANAIATATTTATTATDST